MLNQLAQKLRIESRAKRLELFKELMRKDDELDEYEAYGKAMDIARRIMRGERVSIEEMRFLAQHFPELLFQAMLLRNLDPDIDRDYDQQYNKGTQDDTDRSDAGSYFGDIANKQIKEPNITTDGSDRTA